MDKLFIIQLITSYFGGGGIIALISLLAERANPRVAGIILTFPTTVAIGFFFLGWTVSSKAVAEIIPSILIPFGFSILFPGIYLFIAEICEKFLQSKILKIFLSFSISISIWFLIVLPLIIFKFSNLIIGIIGYFLLIFISHLLLSRKKYKKSVSLTYTTRQKISRASFIGFILFLVVLLSKTLNPFFGGIFTIFPAVFSSLLITFHWYYEPKNLYPILQKAAIGSISPFMYIITAMLTFPKTGFIIGTFISLIISWCVTLLLMKWK